MSCTSRQGDVCKHGPYSSCFRLLSSASGAMPQTVSANRGKIMDFGALVVEGLRAQEHLPSQDMERPSETGEPKALI